MTPGRAVVGRALDLVAGELLLGMMWQSPKARDLLRDVDDEALRAAYRAAVVKRIDWEPTDPFHLFAADIQSAGFVTFGDDAYGMAWDPAGGTRRWSQRLE